MRDKLRAFKPSLNTIFEEDYPLSSDDFTTSFDSDGIIITSIQKGWDADEYREKLFGPHRYIPKCSRNDPTLRYSYDRTSVGLNHFIKQQREKMATSLKIRKNINIFNNGTIRQLPSFGSNIIRKPSQEMQYNVTWEQWASPKKQVTPDDIIDRYGLRWQRWDSRKHKEELINKALQPTLYQFKHAVNDVSRRFSYEKSSEGFRAFLRSKKS